MKSSTSNCHADGHNLQCNVCSCRVDGIAYRTSCRHFFCPQCAIKSLQRGTHCPICSHALGNGEVNEINIGLLNLDVSASDILFQHALQNTTWENILTNVEKLSTALSDLNSFIFSQLCLKISIHSKVVISAREEKEKYCQNANALADRVNELEEILEINNKKWGQELQQRNKEIAEIQEAYKEKNRKCQAWEKAYNNIRSQITSGGDWQTLGGRDERNILIYSNDLWRIYASSVNYSGVMNGEAENIGELKRSFRRTEVATYRKALHGINSIVAPAAAESWSQIIGRAHGVNYSENSQSPPLISEGNSFIDLRHKIAPEIDIRAHGTSRHTANTTANDRKKTVNHAQKSSPRWSMGNESQQQSDHHAPQLYVSRVANKEKRSFFDTTS